MGYAAGIFLLTVSGEAPWVDVCPETSYRGQWYLVGHPCLQRFGYQVQMELR